MLNYTFKLIVIELAELIVIIIVIKFIIII